MGQKSTMAKPSPMRYLDEFLTMSSAPAMIETKLFPNSKEITESMAAYEAFRRFLAPSCSNFDNEQDAFVFVGDGATPRTAALFAYLTKGGRCYAIDPLLKDACSQLEHPRKKEGMDVAAPAVESKDAMAGCAAQHPWQHIRRLKVVPHRVEKVSMRLRRVVVVMVHCHCSLQQVVDRIQCEELVGLITAPCCNWGKVQQTLMGLPPVACYKDPCMLSEKSDLRVWCSNRDAGADSARTLFRINTMLPPDLSVPGTVVLPSYSDDGVSCSEETAPSTNSDVAPQNSARTGERELADFELTEEVTRELDQEFTLNPHRSRPRELHPIAQRLQLPVFQVRVWFKHQREKRGVTADRREGRPVKESTKVDTDNREKREQFRATIVGGGGGGDSTTPGEDGGDDGQRRVGCTVLWPERGVEVRGFSAKLSDMTEASANATVQRLLELHEPLRLNWTPDHARAAASGQASSEPSAETAGEASEEGAKEEGGGPGPGGGGGGGAALSAAQRAECLRLLESAMKGHGGSWWTPPLSGASRVVGRVLRRRYKLRVHPAILHLVDRCQPAQDASEPAQEPQELSASGARESRAAGRGGGAEGEKVLPLRIVISRNAMPCAEKEFQQLLSSIRIGDVVEIVGVPVWTAIDDVAGWGVYAWGLRLLVRRYGEETVYTV